MKLKLIDQNRLLRILIKIFILLIISSIIFMLFDYSHWNGIDEKRDKKILDKFIARLYFVSTTLSSVGYGDITPKTNSNRILTIFLHIIVLITIIEFIKIEFSN